MTTIQFPLNAQINRREIPGITVSHLTVAYRQVPVLVDVNCEIARGRLTGIIGPNGAGKSTLIKAMLGLVPGVVAGENSGIILYQGQPLANQREKVAYVPQRSQIDWTFPATVWDVVMMGRVQKTGWFRSFSSVSRRLGAEALARVGMSDYRDRQIGELSGGQQQRVFLARSLAQEAEIYCFDEPFVGIDHKTQEIIFDIFHELADQGKTVIVVNHDLGNSIANFDDLILLNRQVIACGPRPQVLQAENLYQAYGGQVVFFNSEAA